MSRKQLEDEILYQRRYLKSLEDTQTNCRSCARLRYKTNDCMLFGLVPREFMERSDCPSWEFELIPF